MKKFLVKKEKLTHQNRFLCSVSGGQDSIVSLFVLLNFIKNNSLQVFYFQHFWQLKNFVSAFLIFEISFFVETPYTLILPYTTLLSENRSRDWRRKNFCRISHLEKFSNLVTGQTQTDILEKTVNNLIRGTSLSGFAESSVLSSTKTQGFFFTSLILKTRFLFLSKICLSHNENCGPRFLFQTKTLLLRRAKKPKQKNILKFRSKYSLIHRQQPKQSLSFQNFQEIRNTLKFLKNPKVQLNQNLSSFSFQLYQRNLNFLKFYYVHTQNLELKARVGKINLKNRGNMSVCFCFYSQTQGTQLNPLKLLEMKHRVTVSKLVNFYNLPVLIDLTNFNSKFSRNKIRSQFFPFIRSLFHPKVEVLFLQFFQTSLLERKELENQLLNFYVLAKWNQVNLLKKQNSIVLKNLKNKQFKFHSCFYKENSFFCQIVAQKSGLNSTFFKKIVLNYSDIDLNFSQIFYLLNLFSRKTRYKGSLS